MFSKHVFHAQDVCLVMHTHRPSHDPETSHKLPAWGVQSLPFRGADASHKRLKTRGLTDHMGSYPPQSVLWNSIFIFILFFKPWSVVQTKGKILLDSQSMSAIWVRVLQQGALCLPLVFASAMVPLQHFCRSQIPESSFDIPEYQQLTSACFYIAVLCFQWVDQRVWLSLKEHFRDVF